MTTYTAVLRRLYDKETPMIVTTEGIERDLPARVADLLAELAPYGRVLSLLVDEIGTTVRIEASPEVAAACAGVTTHEDWRSGQPAVSIVRQGLTSSLSIVLLLPVVPVEAAS